MQHDIVIQTLYPKRANHTLRCDATHAAKLAQAAFTGDRREDRALLYQQAGADHFQLSRLARKWIWEVGSM